MNDNLLPLLRHDAIVDEMLHSEVEKRAAIMKVDEQLNPWIEVAKASKASENIQKSTVTLGDLSLGVYLPVELPPVRPFLVYWDAKTELLVTVSSNHLRAKIEVAAVFSLCETDFQMKPRESCRCLQRLELR